MSELEKTKNIIIKNIQRLCAHCVNGVEHKCPVQKIAEQISGIREVPLTIDDEFRGVIFR